MKQPEITRENLIIEFNQLLPRLKAEVGPEIGQWLQGRRTVARHGTCSAVLYWPFWDSRQRSLGVDPVYFTYAVSYDPVRFELTGHDWALVLHLNTVRSYYGTFELREFLAREMKPATPRGFEWQEHPRQFRVIREFDHAGPVSELGEAILKPLARLVTATHPVLDKLFKELEGTAATGTARQQIIAGRKVPNAPASHADRPGDKKAMNRGISGRLRDQVVARHGMVCHLCQQAITDPAELHIDHVVPWAEGGLTQLDNLRPSHQQCNLSKGAGGKVIPPEQRSPARKRIGWKKNGGR